MDQFEVVVSKAEALTPRIREFVLARANGAPMPGWALCAGGPPLLIGGRMAREIPPVAHHAAQRKMHVIEIQAAVRQQR